MKLLAPLTKDEWERIHARDRARIEARKAARRRCDEVSMALVKRPPHEIPDELISFVASRRRYLLGAFGTDIGKDPARAPLWQVSASAGRYVGDDGIVWEHTESAGWTFEPARENRGGQVWFSLPAGQPACPETRVEDRPGTGSRPERWRHWAVGGGLAVDRHHLSHSSQEQGLRLLAECAREHLRPPTS